MPEAYETLKYVKLGINETIYYDYEGNQVPLRPITSIELDDCFFRGLKFAPTNIAKFVVELKLGIAKPKGVINLSNEGYAELVQYYRSVNYWIVYHAMKDFQEEWFKEPSNEDQEIPKGYYKVLEMRHVHEMSRLVLSHSTAPEEVIKEVIKTKRGKVLGTLVFNLNVPLTDQAWKLTDLQKQFLYYTKTGGVKKKNVDISISGETMKLSDFIKQVA